MDVLQSSSSIGCHGRTTTPGWLDALRTQYAAVFAEGLGTCRTYMVRSFPFKFSLPWKVQPSNRMSGPAEEACTLEEILKLVKLGVVRRLSTSPTLSLLLACPKKWFDPAGFGLSEIQFLCYPPAIPPSPPGAVLGGLTALPHWFCT